MMFGECGSRLNAGDALAVLVYFAPQVVVNSAILGAIIPFLFARGFENICKTTKFSFVFLLTYEFATIGLCKRRTKISTDFLLLLLLGKRNTGAMAYLGWSKTPTNGGYRKSCFSKHRFLSFASTLSDSLPPTQRYQI